MSFSCSSVTVVAIPTSCDARCKQEDAVNNIFSGQSVKMKATVILKTPHWALAASEKAQPCLELRRGTQHVSLCCQLHTFWCSPVAIPAPVYAPAPYPALPKCTLLLQCMSSCCAIAHTGLLFDFTSVLRRLRQARPGISAMWLKNGDRRQEYKRRHTGCGCGSLAWEWVVD